MEENTQTEQFQGLDEEQMQAVTGAGIPEPKESVSPIAFHLGMADKLFAKADLAQQRGLTSIADKITENGFKHLTHANQLQEEVAAGKKPMQPDPKPQSPSTSNNGGTLRIHR